MKPSHLALTLCTTASAAHAQQLVPMASQPEPTSALLSPFQNPITSPLPLADLTPMAGPSPSATLPVPMKLAAPDADITLTPLQRMGQPEVMRGRTDSVANPVAPLAPLPPPKPTVPAQAKPITLSKSGTKPILAAGSPPGSTTAMAATLTDTALPPNPDIPTIERPEDQLIFASVILNGIPRRTLIEVYQDNEQNLWLPLTPMAQLLEIPLSVNAAAGVAQGWYLAPTNTLVINMAEGKTTLGKQTFPTGNDIEKHAADLYLTATALKEWLGVTVTLDFNELVLTITTPSPLPGDLRARRESNWETLAAARLRNAEPSDTLIPGYADFSLPVLRLGATSNFTRPAEGNAAMATGLTVQAENDILGMNSNIALAFSQDTNNRAHSGLTGGSILLQKHSEKADLLGSLNARYFGVGDITTDPIPLSGLSSRGRGVRVNNTPEGAVNNPDQYILTGPAPINWDVEVYQNQTLVDYSRIDSSGTYRFTALPLRSGRNVFRLVFYGPNGEREERRETIYLADNLPEVGEWRYDTAVYQPNKFTLPGLPNQPSGTTTTAQVQFSTGLTKNWAATVGTFQSTGSSLSNADYMPEENGISTGLRGSVGGTYFTSDLFNSGNGSALQSTLRMPVTQAADLRLGHSRNMGYDSLRRDQLTTSEAELSIPFTVGRMALDTTYGYTHTTYQTQPLKNTYSQRTSVGIGAFNATNQLDLTTQAGRQQINGSIETTAHVLNKAWRTGLTYQPNSSDLLREFYVNTQLPVGEAQTVNLTYTQQLTTPQTANLSGGMYWRAGPLALGVQGQAATTGNLQLGLNLTTALVPQGSTHNLSAARWRLTQPNGTIGQGQAGVRVFADANSNNTFDSGDSPLPNVTVYNRQRGDSAITNASGIATFSSLTPNTLARLEIDLTTLPDIYLKPVSDTLNVKPHAGDNGILNYAVKLYGEISGQAFAKGGQPIHNLSVTLLNAQGKTVDNTTTETDGYFTFGALPMGAYTLQAGTTSATVTLTPAIRILSRNITF